MRAHVHSALFFILLASELPAAEPAAVDKYLAQQLEKRSIPGLSVAVIRNGKVELAKGYGSASLELAVPAGPQTVYEIGSVTKMFTATAVLQQMEDGKLGLDDLVSRYVSGLPSGWSRVTLRHLLTHTSGIKSFTSVPKFQKEVEKDYTPRELVALVEGTPLEFLPGERWSYSNTGYALLGMVLEQVSGKPYGTLLEERIFRPLKMTSTRVNDRASIIKNRAAGYTLEQDKLQNPVPTRLSQAFGAGTLVSTVTDLALWDAALSSEKLLKASSLAQMWTPARLADGSEATYGFGWGVNAVAKHRVLTHGGGISGFGADFLRFPDDKVTVIVLMNTDSAPPEKIAAGVAALYLPDLAAADQPIADDDPATTARLRAIYVEITRGEGQAAFTPEAARAFYPERMKSWSSFLGQQGELESFALLETKANGGVTVRTYRVATKKFTASVLFSLTAQGKLADFAVHPE
ncbi:MAG: serine hydrolase [Thermoanaerobaculia bacterium]